jgi:uncharacterized short protein YbdD (DUF466 family)
MGGMRAAARAFWSWLRAVTGDSAYEAYESYVRRARPGGAALLSREAFYLETLSRRYSTINRCC